MFQNRFPRVVRSEPRDRRNRFAVYAVSEHFVRLGITHFERVRVGSRNSESAQIERNRGNPVPDRGIHRNRRRGKRVGFRKDRHVVVYGERRIVQTDESRFGSRTLVGVHVHLFGYDALSAQTFGYDQRKFFAVGNRIGAFDIHAVRGNRRTVETVLHQKSAFGIEQVDAVCGKRFGIVGFCHR